MSDAARRLTLVATILGSTIAFVDATVVSVALPTIERDLDLGLTGEQWVVLSYSLALGSLYLTGGALGDRFGRRETFAVGTIGFVAASALAGAAPNAGVLIAGRALQGVAGAVLTPTSLGLLRATFGRESGRAIGIWTAWTSAAGVAGPPVGGAIAEWASWRLIFFVNIPLGAAAVSLALAARREPEVERERRPLDLPGAALAAAGLGALAFGLVEAGRDGFGAVASWAPLAAAAPLLVVFLMFEARARAPMLPLSLFRPRELAVANAETFLVYAALSAVAFYLALYLQSTGFSAFATGALMTPASLVLIALGARFGTVADRVGVRPLLAAGPMVVGCGTLLFLLLGPASGWPLVLPGILVFGLGIAMTVAPITTAALRSAPDRHAGLAAGVNATISRVGALVAIAVVGIVVAAAYDGRGEPLAKDQHGAAAQASTTAFRAGMAVAAGLAFAGGAVGLLGLRRE